MKEIKLNNTTKIIWFFFFGEMEGSLTTTPTPTVTLGSTIIQCQCRIGYSGRHCDVDTIFIQQLKNCCSHGLVNNISPQKTYSNYSKLEFQMPMVQLQPLVIFFFFAKLIKSWVINSSNSSWKIDWHWKLIFTLLPVNFYLEFFDKQVLFNFSKLLFFHELHCIPY